MIWTVFAGCFLGRIGGATTFALAKVKDANGRIGIFNSEISVQKHLKLFVTLITLTCGVLLCFNSWNNDIIVEMCTQILLIGFKNVA